MRRLLATLTLALAVLSGGIAPVAGQEASPVASPAGVCDAPALPPGTPTPMEGPAPEASPDASHAGMEMGTHEGTDSAEAVSEVADAGTPAPAGIPADTAATDQVAAAAENIVACLNTGNFLGFAALVTPNYLLTEFGTANPYDLPVFLDGFPPQELRSIGEAETHEDGRVSVVLTTVLGGTQVDRFRAYFVPTGGPLLLDEEEPLPIQGAAETVDVSMEDYTFTLSRESVPAGELVAFTIGNYGQYPHELAVVRVPEGVTVDQVLDDPALQEEIQFVGGVFAEPGEIAYRVWRDWRRGPTWRSASSMCRRGCRTLSGAWWRSLWPSRDGGGQTGRREGTAALLPFPPLRYGGEEEGRRGI